MYLFTSECNIESLRRHETVERGAAERLVGAVEGPSLSEVDLLTNSNLQVFVLDFQSQVDVFIYRLPPLPPTSRIDV